MLKEPDRLGPMESKDIRDEVAMHRDMTLTLEKGLRANKILRRSLLNTEADMRTTINRDSSLRVIPEVVTTKAIIKGMTGSSRQTRATVTVPSRITNSSSNSSTSSLTTTSVSTLREVNLTTNSTSTMISNTLLISVNSSSMTIKAHKARTPPQSLCSLSSKTGSLWGCSRNLGSFKINQHRISSNSISSSIEIKEITKVIDSMDSTKSERKCVSIYSN